ncbi:amidohydrolase family protein [Streptomyces marincola]|uniref:amidohydrolase family protein n=1 Tax=Streptomyces marincola TaxID=2878388 RepID=UPI001CF3A133|nr:amidohydrolase family protein [Streptomyces marincola]UCM86728.1 amidohydrolase family protein [Streptomyces marincola]
MTPAGGPGPRPVRVDAHHHVWDLGRRPQPWLDTARTAAIHRTLLLEDLAGPAAAAGIDRTVLVQVLPDTGETAEFLALAAGDALVAGVVGWADLTLGPAVAEQLDRLRAGPGGHLLVGVRHLVQGEADPRWLCRPDVRAGLAAVAAAGLAYDLLVLPRQLPAAIETARALPELTFVLDHLAKPPIASGATEPWAGLITALAERPNVHAKLSGLVTEADWERWRVADLRPYADHALTAFGPRRLMFGSDWPVCLPAASYARVAETAGELLAGLGGTERAEVFGGTAERVYRLPPG